MQNILFRADASSEIGMGHIMRDLVLAEHYADATIIFATQDLKGNANSKIIDKGYELITLEAHGVEELISIIKVRNIDMVIFDHYKIDFAFEKKVKEETGVIILSFDDTYEKHFCDILLNHNISAKEERYVGLVPSECELRCGKKHTLIREEFKHTPLRIRETLKNKKTIRFFISMGGVDHTNITPKILDALSENDDYTFEVVTTTNNKHLEALKSKVKNLKNVILHIDTKGIAAIMNECDIAIITPSVTVHEVLCMKIPFIAIKTALNQTDMLEYLQIHKYFILETFDSIKLYKNIDFLVKVKNNDS